MTLITYREALRMGLYEALEKDERVFLMGEDVGKYGGTYAVSKGMLEKFGPQRVRDTPLSELAFVGAGIGAALADPDPVLVFEYPALFEAKDELSAENVDISSAKIRRAGSKVTLITYGACLPKTLQAAEEVDGEVIDLRVLRPLDMQTVLNSVRKTRRAVVIDEGWRSGSLAAEIMARIVEQAFYDLDAPLARVCREEVPIPYARHLEEAALPQPEKIVAAAKALFA